MDNELAPIIDRREGETPQDHYRRLVEWRAQFETTFRAVKTLAGEAEHAREYERRRVRDLKRFAATDSTEEPKG